MFGCIGRAVVVVALLIVVGATAYVTRAWWEPPLRERLGVRPPVTATAPAWEPVTAAGAVRVRDALAALRRPTGPAFVNVSAGDLVAFALDSALRSTGTSDSPARGTTALAGENTISIRTTVRMKDLGGAASLGPLAGVLDGDQPIELRGHLDVPARGRAQFRVERIAVGHLVLPSAAIGTIVQRLAPRRDKAFEGTAIAIALPAEVADIRVTPGRVTLYKAVR